jgi:tetratricopeptide (TPR) repeat protein
MSSKKPLLSSSNSHKEQFLQHNAAELDGIELFAELSEGFTIGFMEANSDLDREFVVDYFKNRDQPNTVQWVTIRLAEEDLQYFGLEVRKQLQAVELIPGRKPVLLISGLERSIGVTAEYPDVLVNLNMERDSYPRILPYPVIFLLPSYALARVAHYAPDFWAWKSIEVKLPSDIHRSPSASVNFYGVVKSITGLESNNIIKPISQDRFDDLEKSLSEHSEPTIRRAQLLKQIGDACTINYKNDLAEIAYRSSLDIYSNLPTSFDQSSTLMALAKLYHFQGKDLLALKVWQQTLPIYKKLSDQRGEAQVLCYLSIIYESLGELQKALKCSEQSLKISKEVGNRQVEASSLYEMSRIYCDLKELQQALIFAEGTLKIYRELHDKTGESDALYNLSRIYQKSGELQKALDFSEQSLKIDRKIKNQKGEAYSLHSMSKIYYDLGELQKALILSEQALRMFQEISIHSAIAKSFHHMSKIYCNLGELSKALFLAKQSLNINQKLGVQKNMRYPLQQISMIYEKLGELQKALDFSEQALKICQEIGDRAMEKDVSDQLTRIRQALTD